MLDGAAKGDGRLLVGIALGFQCGACALDFRCEFAFCGSCHGVFVFGWARSREMMNKCKLTYVNAAR